MTIERILGTDTGKVAFEKADRNFVGHDEQINNIFPYRETIASNVALNSLQQGTYVHFNSNWMHKPAEANIYGLITVVRNSSYMSIEYLDQYNNLFKRFVSTSSGDSIGWIKIATDKQPDWITATLQNGWTGNLQYRINSIGQLELRGNIIAGTIVAWTQVAQIVIPSLDIQAKSILVYNAQTGEGLTCIRLLNTGVMTISNNTNGINAGNVLFINDIIVF